MSRRFVQGFVAGAVLAGTVAALVFFVPGSVDAQNKKKPQFQEVQAGSIPAEYGDVKAVTEQSGKLKIVMVDENNKIRIVEMSGGNKVVPKAYVVERHY